MVEKLLKSGDYSVGLCFQVPVLQQSWYQTLTSIPVLRVMSTSMLPPKELKGCGTREGKRRFYQSYHFLTKNDTSRKLRSRSATPVAGTAAHFLFHIS